MDHFVSLSGNSKTFGKHETTVSGSELNGCEKV